MKIADSGRAFSIHFAKVCLGEAARRRHDIDFHILLMTWAANARRRAAAEPRQKELALG